MTTVTPIPTDNRRAIVRIVAHEMVRISTAMAPVHGDDVIEYLVFTAIWVLNSQHLIGDDRYAPLKSIPPDTQRRPVSIDELRRTVPMPDHILTSYVEKMIANGVVERTPGGLVVPSAVFTQPGMVSGANDLYARVVGMVAAMRNAGFSFGDA